MCPSRKVTFGRCIAICAAVCLAGCLSNGQEPHAQALTTQIPVTTKRITTTKISMPAATTPQTIETTEKMSTSKISMPAAGTPQPTSKLQTQPTAGEALSTSTPRSGDTDRRQIRSTNEETTKIMTTMNPSMPEAANSPPTGMGPSNSPHGTDNTITKPISPSTKAELSSVLTKPIISSSTISSTKEKSNETMTTSTNTPAATTTQSTSMVHSNSTPRTDNTTTSPISSSTKGIDRNNTTAKSPTTEPTKTTTAPVCGTRNDFKCKSLIDYKGNHSLLCTWNKEDQLWNYTVSCVATANSRGNTTKGNYIHILNMEPGNYTCTLKRNGCNEESINIPILKKSQPTTTKPSVTPGPVNDKNQDNSGSENGKIVTIVLLLVIVIVCLIVSRNFYMKNKKLERQYNSEEGVCLLPKALWGFQKETIITNVDPIPAKVLRQTVQTKSASDSKVFQQEFNTFPRVIEKYSRQDAIQPQNSKKNRYSDILPYDQNRVKLSSNGGSGSDYINASYVEGYRSSIRYIAAQGPLEHTAGDFWQMIWEKKSSVIVMVTKCEEMGKVKCFQYWPHPDEDKKTYGDITVTIIDEKIYADIVIRTLSITHGKHKGFGAHSVTHVQLVSWPDHGVPEDPNLLLKLRRRVNSFNGAGSTAIVVHCSAGVGRSGTYIGLDCLVRQLENEGQVDVYGCVYRLRHQRALMVQVESQYVLLHRALLEHHLFGNTELSISKLHSRVQAMKLKDSQQEASPVDAEFKRLPTFEDTFAQKAGRNNNNVGKNRSTNVIPYDFNRVKMWKFTPSNGEDDKDNWSDEDEDDDNESDNENSDKDYINASFMDGYHKQKTYIATQNPLPDTVSDFWLLVAQQNCSHIVMLSELSEGQKEECAHYWPVKGRQNYADVKVTVKNETFRQDLTVREFAVAYEGKESVVTQYQYTHWKPDGLPKSPKALIAIINAVQCWQKRHGNNGHILVHCSDGASRTGTFCALWNTLEAARVERMVDFFQAVKWLKMQRPEIVNNKVHYRFLYETVSSFMNSTNGIQYACQVALQNGGSMHSVDIISEL